MGLRTLHTRSMHREGCVLSLGESREVARDPRPTPAHECDLLGQRVGIGYNVSRPRGR